MPRHKFQHLPRQIPWLLQGGFTIGRLRDGTPIQVSNFGVLTTFGIPEQENVSNIVNIIKARSRAEQHELVSVRIDDESFLPVSFLEMGVKQSSAVCRIARFFSQTEFITFLEELEQAIQSLGNIPHNFDSADKVIEVFSIPQSIAENIFDTSIREAIILGQTTPIKVLKNITPNQLTTLLPIPIGTGFLVGSNHLLTNYHVIPNGAIANQCVAQFGFEGTQKSIDYECDPGSLFISTPALDYTLVQLKSKLLTRQAGNEFGWIQLIENSESVKPRFRWIELEGTPEQVELTLETGKQAITALISDSRGYIIQAEETSIIIWHPRAGTSQLEEFYEEEEVKELARLMGYEAFHNDPGKPILGSSVSKFERGDPIIVVQHPKGKQKQLVLNNNEVILNGLYRYFVRYAADADYSSSGSPAFNMRWELVALHHAAIPKVIEQQQQTSEDKMPVECHQGIRTCRIVEDLKQKQSSEPNLQSFVENFVASSECLNYPALSTGIRFDGIDDYISIDSKVYFASCATNFGEDSDPRSVDRGISTIKFWNRSGIELRTLTHPGVQKIKFSPDGYWLASSGASSNHEIRLWNVETGSLIRVLSIQNEQMSNDVMTQNYLDSVTSISFSPPSNQLLAVANIFGHITLWDTSTGNWLNSQNGNLLATHPELREIKGCLNHSAVRFSQDGQFLAVNNEESVQLWKTDNWSLQNIETTHSQTICFSSNNKTLAIATQDGFLQFFDLETGVLSEKIRADKRSINQIEFISAGGSFENETLLSFGSEGLVRFWSLDGHLIEEFTIDPEIVRRGIQSTDFSPDGKTLIIFGLATEISLVNIETQEIKTIKHFKQTMQRRGADFPYADVKFNTHVLPTGFANFAAMETTRSFTVEAWINPDVNGGGAIFDLALEFAQGRTGKFVLSITPQNDVSGYLKISFFDFRRSTLESGAGEILLGKFNHVAVVVEDSEEVTCYINGRSTGGSSLSSQTAICGFFPRLQVIGASAESDDFVPFLSNFFKGIISEIRLWNTARTSEQLFENRYRPLIAQESGLIGYWKFEEGLGDKVFNLSSNSEDYGLTIGTKRLTTHQLPFFPFPIGLSFSETGHYVNCGNTPNLNTEQITVEAWIKHQYGNCLIVNRGFSSEAGYALSWHDSKIRVILKDDSSTDKTTIVDTRNSMPQDHVWHHIAFTWDNSFSEISLYLDGRLQDSVVIQGRSKTITSAGKSLTFGLFTGYANNLAANLLIGQKENENGNAKKKMYYDVKIAEVRLWSVVRSQDQIKSNMARRLSNRDVDWEDLLGYWRLDNCEQNGETRNLKSDSSPGVIHGARLFPTTPCISIAVP